MQQQEHLLGINELELHLEHVEVLDLEGVSAKFSQIKQLIDIMAVYNELVHFELVVSWFHLVLDQKQLVIAKYS